MAKKPNPQDQTGLILQFGTGAIAAALERCGVGEEGIVCVLEEHSSAFTVDMRDAAIALLQKYSVPGEFRNEEVASDFSYPPEYKGPKPIAEQVRILRELLPELRSADESIACRVLPRHAEGWFAIPRWERIARSYGGAVERIFQLLELQRKFCNKSGGLSSKQLQQTNVKEEALQQFRAQQGGHDIMVIPAQFGLDHRGKSTRRARVLFKRRNEFGLGAFEVGVMLLTHPERIIRLDQLHVDAAGDESSWKGSKDLFDSVSFFMGGINILVFNRSPSSDFNSCCGTASAFKM